MKNDFSSNQEKTHRAGVRRGGVCLVFGALAALAIQLDAEHIEGCGRGHDALPKLFDGPRAGVAAIGGEIGAGPAEFLQDGGEAGGVVHDLPAIREDDGDAVGAGGVMTGDFHGLLFFETPAFPSFGFSAAHVGESCGCIAILSTGAPAAAFAFPYDIGLGEKLGVGADKVLQVGDLMDFAIGIDQRPLFCVDVGFAAPGKRTELRCFRGPCIVVVSHRKQPSAAGFSVFVGSSFHQSSLLNIADQIAAETREHPPWSAPAISPLAVSAHKDFAFSCDADFVVAGIAKQVLADLGVGDAFHFSGWCGVGGRFVRLKSTYTFLVYLQGQSTDTFPNFETF